jgi:hypothetical protein
MPHFAILPKKFLRSIQPGVCAKVAAVEALPAIEKVPKSGILLRMHGNPSCGKRVQPGTALRYDRVLRIL